MRFRRRHPQHAPGTPSLPVPPPHPPTKKRYSAGCLPQLNVGLPRSLLLVFRRRRSHYHPAIASTSTVTANETNDTAIDAIDAGSREESNLFISSTIITTTHPTNDAHTTTATTSSTPTTPTATTLTTTTLPPTTTTPPPPAMKNDRTKGDDEMTVVVPPSKAKPADAEGDVAMDGTDQAVNEKVDPVAQTVADITANFALLDRAVALFDARFTLRALRSISLIRKRLTPDIVAQVVSETFVAAPTAAEVARPLLAAIDRQHVPLGSSSSSRPESSAMEVVDVDVKKTKKEKDQELIPEVDIFLGILVQVLLLDAKEYDRGQQFSAYLADRIHSLNRRTLDSLSAKVYFYYSLFAENLAPQPPSPQSPVVAIRPALLKALRTAILRKDVDTQAAVIVLLMRNYLSTAHIAQADLLVTHNQFPETAANNQVARYLYYLGRIRAIQLRYTEAHEHLTAATRKAPSSTSAVGFAQTATKLMLIVELLMGDIPDRATFRQPTLELSLHPYFLLVQAVRVGNVESFENIIHNYAGIFRRDGTYTLIVRLRQNVIKTGIRMMSLAYSRISLRDICIRLHLDSEESAEYIVAKAIRDGVIEATLDRERGYMKSKDVGDVYATREPGEAFHDRIRACLVLHDESVKAMRFPMNQHRLELKNAQQAHEREREMAQEIQDNDLDEDDLGGDF